MKKLLHATIVSADFELSTRHGAIPVSRLRILSADLFGIGTAREVVIEHAGEEYRLTFDPAGEAHPDEISLFVRFVLCCW